MQYAWVFMYAEGEDVKQNYKKAAELFQQACDSGFAEGCHNLGSLYYNGRGVRQDYKKAFEFAKKACDGGDSLSCHNLGVLYAKGQGIRQDKSQAKEYYSKACDLENKKVVMGIENSMSKGIEV